MEAICTEQLPLILIRMYHNVAATWFTAPLSRDEGVRIEDEEVVRFGKIELIGVWRCPPAERCVGVQNAICAV